MKRIKSRAQVVRSTQSKLRSRKPLIESLQARIAMAADMMFVKDINTLAETVGGTPSEFVQVGTTMYFTASGSATGRELWKTDGTEAGTVLVKDIALRVTTSEPAYRTNVNSTLYFTADNITNGMEIWKTDGTNAGTVRTTTVTSDPIGIAPTTLGTFRGGLVFAAVDGVHGSELWGQVSNVAPTDILLSGNSVPENSAVPTTIDILSSIDPDVGDTITYTLVPGTGDVDNTSFKIVGTTLSAKNSFDFETKPAYSLRIRTIDLGGLFTE